MDGCGVAKHQGGDDRPELGKTHFQKLLTAGRGQYEVIGPPAVLDVGMSCVPWQRLVQGPPTCAQIEGGREKGERLSWWHR